jgi:hypothetical protein
MGYFKGKREAKEKAVADRRKKYDEGVKKMAAELQLECDKFNSEQKWVDCNSSEKAFAQEKKEQSVHIETWPYSWDKPEKDVKINTEMLYKCKWTKKSCEAVTHRYRTNDACQTCKIPLVYQMDGEVDV